MRVGLAVLTPSTANSARIVGDGSENELALLVVLAFLGKWVAYYESGTYLLPLSGKEYPYREERKRRVCSRCGEIEDRKI